MNMPLTEVLALVLQCAPAVAPETLIPVLQVESGLRPLAIGVNGAPEIDVNARSPDEAAHKARSLIAAGRSVDLGLGQINSRNLAWLGLTIEDTFDPCRNVAAAAQVLQAAYRPNAADGPQAALRRAFSRYNTGTDHRGFANGYVAKVTAASAQLFPKFVQSEPPASPEPPPRTAWDVFGEAGAAGFLIRIDRPTLRGEN